MCRTGICLDCARSGRRHLECAAGMNGKAQVFAPADVEWLMSNGMHVTLREPGCKPQAAPQNIEPAAAIRSLQDEQHVLDKFCEQQQEHMIAFREIWERLDNAAQERAGQREQAAAQEWAEQAAVAQEGAEQAGAEDERAEHEVDAAAHEGAEQAAEHEVDAAAHEGAEQAAAEHEVDAAAHEGAQQAAAGQEVDAAAHEGAAQASAEQVVKAFSKFQQIQVRCS